LLYTPFIGIVNTDFPIINAIKEIVGLGEITFRGRNSENHKPTYVWRILSLKPILQLLESVVHLIKSNRKREIANLVIEFCKSRLERRKHWRTLPYTDREIEIAKRVAELNKRGREVTKISVSHPLTNQPQIQLNSSNYQKLNQISDTDKSYFVAMLEAEGGASIHSTKQFYAGVCRMIYAPYMGIANTDYAIIDAIFRITGVGCINIRKRYVERGHNIVYEWKVTSFRLVLELCQQIVNVMRSERKKKIVKLVIEFCRARLDEFNNSTRAPYGKREIGIYRTVAVLNRRGKGYYRAKSKSVNRER
jgi:hypothetical protein